MSCLLTLQTQSLRTHWREMLSDTHTYTLQAAIHYIHNHTQWHAPSWNTRTQKHTHTKSWVNRVQFLLLPWSDNGSSITGLTNQTVPRDSKKERWKKRGKKKLSRPRDIRGRRLKKSSQQNRLGRKKKKERERERSSYKQDILQSPPGFCLHGFVSKEVATLKLYFITWTQTATCEENSRCACNCMPRFACVVHINMRTCGFVLVYAQVHVSVYLRHRYVLSLLLSSVLYIRKRPASVSVPLCLTLACTDPL